MHILPGINSIEKCLMLTPMDEAGPAWTDGVPGRRAGETEGALASPHTYGQVPLPSHQQGRGWRKALLRTRSCLCGREGLEAGGQPDRKSVV